MTGRVAITHPVDALVSYHYFPDESDMLPLVESGRLTLIGDSGAFSALTQGASVDIGAYADWVNRWREHLLWVASLDVIGDPVGSMRNWRKLRERWAVAMLRRARDRHPGVRYHLWGVTNRRYLDSLPVWSADSSGTLSRVVRYASLRLFDPATGHDHNVLLAGRNIYAHGQLLRRVYGVDPADIERSHAGNRQILIALMAAVTQQYAGWLGRRHGVTPPALLDGRIGDEPGPRIHLVSTRDDLLTAVGSPIPEKRGAAMTRSLVLLSGGLDSTVLAGHLLDHGDTITAVSVDYGQRHRRELDAAAAVAAHYQVDHTVIDLSGLGRMLGGSALTDPLVPVPLGHYADASMRSTVVPNRNAIMLMAAVGVASAHGLDRVAVAVHAGDHPVYPDCRPDFVRAAGEVARLATRGFGDVDVFAPFVNLDKTWIARRGVQIGAPIALTWSCYQGGTVHCGACGTCVERKEALHLYDDPTVYADAVPA